MIVVWILSVYLPVLNDSCVRIVCVSANPQWWLCEDCLYISQSSMLIVWVLSLYQPVLNDSCVRIVFILANPEWWLCEDCSFRLISLGIFLCAINLAFISLYRTVTAPASCVWCSPVPPGTFGAVPYRVPWPLALILLYQSIFQIHISFYTTLSYSCIQHYEVTE
jgi:hypothetical protein